MEKKTSFKPFVLLQSHLLLCYCVNMASVTSVSRYITPASRYQPCYQRRSPMNIRGLILRNFAELAEAVPMGGSVVGDPLLSFTPPT